MVAVRGAARHMLRPRPSGSSSPISARAAMGWSVRGSPCRSTGRGRRASRSRCR